MKEEVSITITPEIEIGLPRNIQKAYTIIIIVKEKGKIEI